MHHYSVTLQMDNNWNGCEWLCGMFDSKSIQNNIWNEIARSSSNSKKVLVGDAGAQWPDGRPYHVSGTNPHDPLQSSWTTTYHVVKFVNTHKKRPIGLEKYSECKLQATNFKHAPKSNHDHILQQEYSTFNPPTTSPRHSIWVFTMSWSKFWRFLFLGQSNDSKMKERPKLWAPLQWTKDNTQLIFDWSW